ncbi:4-diphosphocytidyl-2-C-methyl-D-erythritol kinase, chloroplastic/chromoplastic [Sesamum angolense]|uniref:4-diphosphocytidyl-2-C-methyl-D-erythritol kinase, chloroplastic/chromoplastic n=1 Tax=Sesamum angolense TaxID=2727404 RepID=A0AAE2C440_9LAMI|nr:4-diphosphocytidyl-2-C-methyl-D-erythritol kinase, chloroplastic/chromoplastic [Sesamum angolense]
MVTSAATMEIFAHNASLGELRAIRIMAELLHKDGIDQVHLDKKVPTGAGLGGGSGIAATAFWAANQFSDYVATEKELQEWSSEIGSDIPFFFSLGAAYCTGRGETSKVDPLTLLGKISNNRISQDVCSNDRSMNSRSACMMVLLFQLYSSYASLQWKHYRRGVGSPDPSQFVFNDDEYKDVFLSEARFVTHSANQWYTASFYRCFCLANGVFSIICIVKVKTMRVTKFITLTCLWVFESKDQHNASKL